MALIKSISGIRGTIGGKTNDNLTPLDVVKFTAAYGTWLMQQGNGRTVIIGRDGRISGAMISALVANALIGLGLDVIDLELSTTPTVEMAVKFENAAGGIILTASHNPKEWNALKLLNNKGEFISGDEGKVILELAQKEDFSFAAVDKLGQYKKDDTTLAKHIDAILQHELVDTKAIKKKNFKIYVDAVNSTGAIAVPALLKALGVKETEVLNAEVNGEFAHNPEPLPEHLKELSKAVVKNNADLGIAVDPDVDRLCFVCEDGSMFGEEYTLVAVADYVLTNRKGNTVSNMSSTKALKELTIQHGGEYFPSMVGEVNVVNRMKEVNAVIGGEGNGGVIYPRINFARDSLVGIALVLHLLAESQNTVTELLETIPRYTIVKEKMACPSHRIPAVLKRVRQEFAKFPLDTRDGVKVTQPDGWLLVRGSNTEPIIRIVAEAQIESRAREMVNSILSIL
ncbi:MAG TPA: phosphoglucosamine mutase [Ferruginibacter sp.]|nr:phosphoglucosamine mutase [Ferruginibacter sp.]